MFLCHVLLPGIKTFTQAVVVSRESTFETRLSAGRTGHHPVLEQPALQRAIEQRSAFGGRQANQFWQAHVRRQDIGIPAGALPLEPVAQLWIERLRFSLFADAHAIRGVGDDDAGGCRSGHFQHIALFEIDHAGQEERWVNAWIFCCKNSTAKAIHWHPSR